ncbi:hypothetical protein PanWU01x14_007880 [Parasponia andersonii]|uniref:Ankyrin repeat-containing domain containing protein n=1 Tax=Parasponia andersonii TaxID=3476 RepID=A0A2P5E466_PARAD|nr:hypothetical protein PanWU01x14_007880 [Parasponia andersonii]
MENDREELPIGLAFASGGIDLVDWMLEGDKAMSRFKDGDGNSFLHILWIMKLMLDVDIHDNTVLFKATDFRNYKFFKSLLELVARSLFQTSLQV